ncbi:MAG: hypothetical protein AAF532_16995 [Planctomycetota bacterium]
MTRFATAAAFAVAAVFGTAFTATAEAGLFDRICHPHRHVHSVVTRPMTVTSTPVVRTPTVVSTPAVRTAPAPVVRRAVPSRNVTSVNDSGFPGYEDEYRIGFADGFGRY